MLKTLIAASSIAVMATLLFPHQQVHAADLAECADPASDTDGDGFGWENGQSCRVAEDDSQPAQITDLSSGQSVTFTRASWETKNVENKPVVCVPHYWNADSSTYNPSTSYSEIYYHSPLDTTGTILKEAIYHRHNADLSLKTVLPWNIENGSYTGPGDFGRTPFVEIVSAGGGNNNAVRSWYNNEFYSLCTAFPASDIFVPTGNLPECIDTVPFGNGLGWDGEGTCNVLSDDTRVAGQCDAYFAKPEIECFDIFPQGDGWGWNGVASCQL